MYGVLVIGAPGAGKSTFCAGLVDIFSQINRPYFTINLDPANNLVQYDATYDIKELVAVEEVMDRLGMGPNGALKYCIDTLCRNQDWLLRKIQDNKDKYVILDCPGQLELYKCEGELWKINVLSKVDLFDENASFNLEYFIELPDVNRLLELLNDVPGLERYHALNTAICDVLSNFDMVNFVPLNVQRKEDMANVLRLADSANGWAFHDVSDIRELVVNQ
ncbi:unnamed protein product [Angiostrongylus costaricensis]|uniref:GPN-loop GTPase 2 n=1 Tax=Angiostrongylus costaricensis TaxID=334426 RepID=A0A0R3PQE6_ANGCS|nr:unnamed protein product [Angiostrongylus costaricensis]